MRATALFVDGRDSTYSKVNEVETYIVLDVAVAMPTGGRVIHLVFGGNIRHTFIPKARCPGLRQSSGHC